MRHLLPRSISSSGGAGGTTGVGCADTASATATTTGADIVSATATNAGGGAGDAIGIKKAGDVGACNRGHASGDDDRTAQTRAPVQPITELVMARLVPAGSAYQRWPRIGFKRCIWELRTRETAILGQAEGLTVDCVKPWPSTREYNTARQYDLG